MDQRTYRTVFFDLDGTLLPMDMGEFLKAYFVRLGEFAHKHDLGVIRFGDAMRRSVSAMAQDKTRRSNAEIFWSTFYKEYGYTDRDIEMDINRFYEEDFASLGDEVKPNPAAKRSLDTLHDKGYPLVLTTMPLFPLSAIEWRLKWAGIDPALFARITTYENSFSVKPNLSYYRQNIDLAGCRPSEVLMVGNNTKDDLSIMDLGSDAYLVTDYLLDPDHYPIEEVKHGSMEDFASFAERLAVCS